MFRTSFCAVILLIFSQTPVHASIVGKLVPYKGGGAKLVGYVAYDDDIKGKRPGVILVPDWWGHGNFARDRANALAKLGYVAMIMDNYGNGKWVETPDQAKAHMNAFNADPKAMKAKFMATRKVLRKHELVNKRKIGAIGYSLGGMVVIEMARQGVDLDGVASFWGVIGKPAKPAKKGKVKAKVLVLHPNDDSWAPADAVKALKEEMTGAGTEYKIITYKARHGFSRPDGSAKAKKYKLPLRYDAKVDKQSWQDLSRFLQSVFK